jgi:hypothetical protein
MEALQFARNGHVEPVPRNNRGCGISASPTPERAYAYWDKWDNLRAPESVFGAVGSRGRVIVHRHGDVRGPYAFPLRIGVPFYSALIATNCCWHKSSRYWLSRCRDILREACQETSSTPAPTSNLFRLAEIERELARTYFVLIPLDDAVWDRGSCRQNS